MIHYLIIFTLTRTLGTNGSLGKEITQMKCVNASASCTVIKTSNGELLESKRIDYEKGERLAGEISDRFKNAKVLDTQPGRLSWELFYHGSTLRATLPTEPDEKDDSVLVIMKAEATLMGAAK